MEKVAEEETSSAYAQVRKELESQLLTITEEYLADLQQIQVEFQYGA